MKKLLVIVVVMIMALGLASCGGGGGEESPYAGTYAATSAEYAGIELEVSSLFADGFTLTIESNGKYSVAVDGESDTGKWEEVDGAVVLDGELTLNIDTEAGTAVMDYEGVALNFERQ